MFKNHNAWNKQKICFKWKIKLYFTCEHKLSYFHLWLCHSWKYCISRSIDEIFFDLTLKQTNISIAYNTYKIKIFLRNTRNIGYIWWLHEPWICFRNTWNFWSIVQSCLNLYSLCIIKHVLFYELVKECTPINPILWIHPFLA